MKCSICGKIVNQWYEDEKGKIYCSEKCLERTYPTCCVCGKPMKNWIESDNKKYCSDTCYQKSWPKCSVCGKPMKQWVESQGKKYCSETCYQKTWPKCSVCGKPMKQWVESQGKKYCSDSCYQKTWPKCSVCGRPMKQWIESMGNKYCSETCYESSLPKCNVKIIHASENSVDSNIDYQSSKFEGAAAGGFAAGTYGEVNKLYEEEKFHSRQGHGFSAERANNLYDKMTGHDARIVGDDNEKNGADRIVDGVYIQSKYCRSGKACIDKCFDREGTFRYLRDGKPMQIEVPSDKYEAAVEAMQEKIRRGQIPGISDPEEAKNIVRKGHFTYEQAKNIAKAGTVESLSYDAVNGAVIATSAFGVTAIITFASNLWNGEEFDKSLKVATYSGLKVGGTAFVTTILASQLSKAGLNSALVGSSEAIVAFMGPKASAILINAFREGGKMIYGAAAMKSAAKLLRGNVITAGVTVVILSSFDIANIFRGRISGKQLFKNLTNTASTVVGGTGGWLGGAAIGSAIFPGVGTIVGGLIGSVAGGAVMGKTTDVVLGSFIEDDADEMVRIIEREFGNLSVDYLINQKEAEKIIDELSKKLDGSLLKDMYASSNRKEFAKRLLIPLIEDELSRRKYVKRLTDEQMIKGLKDVLEEISDKINDQNDRGYADHEGMAIGTI